MADEIIQIKRSDTASNTPSLNYGEIAFNNADELFFIGNNSGGNHSFDFLADNLSRVLGNGNDAGSTRITGLSDPNNDQDAATKSYVDATAEGLDVKDSVRAATDGSNIDLTSSTDPNPIDGVTLGNGDRVLLKDQNTDSENGIYDAVTATDPTTWTRSDDFDSDSEVTAGAFTFVEEGTANSHLGFVVTSDDPISVGTDAINFGQFSGAGQITAGDGLTKSGNTINFNAADNSLTVNSDDAGVNPDGTTLETDATDGLRIASSAAGSGLTGGGGSALDVNVDNSTLNIATDTLEVADDGITGTQINSNVAASGLTQDASGNLNVNVDNSTLNIATDTVEVADQGITGTQINTSVAGSGLDGGGGSSLSISSADNSMTINTSDIQLNIDSTGSVTTTGTDSGNPLNVTADGLNIGIDNDSIGLDSNNALEVQNVDGGTF